MSFGLTVPRHWREPTGYPAEEHYRMVFSPEERNAVPYSPPLFRAASGNRYHVEIQTMLCIQIGGYIDQWCAAICGAWNQWQAAATLTGVIINGPTAVGGQVMGPPWTPMILAAAPKKTRMLRKYSRVIANVIGSAWPQFEATVKVPGLPWYPAFAAFPGPMAPPTPNTPVPFAALTQVPTSISRAVLKGQMVAQLGDPHGSFMGELFESLSTAFEQCYNTWKVSTQVTQVLGTGPVPTFAPPFVPGGPVVAGVGNMIPGGFV